MVVIKKGFTKNAKEKKCSELAQKKIRKNRTPQLHDVCGGNKGYSFLFTGY
jgi:hypothetical protein